MKEKSIIQSILIFLFFNVSCQPPRPSRSEAPPFLIVSTKAFIPTENGLHKTPEDILAQHATEAQPLVIKNKSRCTAFLAYCCCCLKN